MNLPKQGNVTSSPTSFFSTSHLVNPIMPVQPGVTRQQAQASNARINAESYPRTAVFVGGTSGIGEALIQGLAAVHKDEWPARIYVVGRQESSERVNESLDRLRAEHPGLDLVWTPGEVSLLADVRRICLALKEKEKSLDLLWLSAGYAPIGGREGQFSPRVQLSRDCALTNKT